MVSENESELPALQFDELVARVRACRLCEDALEHGVRPVLQVDPRARVLIAGQAPGRKVHETGVPFDDASGQRLLDWTGLSAEALRDPQRVAILPMGFCYPGTGTSGDLPPRPECAPAWRAPLLAALPAIELTLVLGRHAMDWHLDRRVRSVTEAVRDWRRTWPHTVPLPHPSPLNNRWLAANPWFADEVLPRLRRRIRSLSI